MSRFATSFGLGFASAALFGAALLLVLKPAQATETSLRDWMRMSPDAKLAHARQVTPEAAGMERTRAILFCLHDLTSRARGNPGTIDLSVAVHQCRDKLDAMSG